MKMMRITRSFAAMIATSTAVMIGLMDLNIIEAHRRGIVETEDLIKDLENKK